MIYKHSLLTYMTCFHILLGGLSFVEAKHNQKSENLDTYTQPKEEHESTFGKALDKTVVEPMFKVSLKAAGAFLKHTPVYFFLQGMVGAPFYPYKATQEYALYKDDAHKQVKIAMVMVPEATGAIFQACIDQKIVQLVRTFILNNPGVGITGFIVNAGIGLVIHALALYSYLKVRERMDRNVHAS